MISFGALASSRVWQCRIHGLLHSPLRCGTHRVLGTSTWGKRRFVSVQAYCFRLFPLDVFFFWGYRRRLVPLRGGLGSGSASINHQWRVMTSHTVVLGPVGDEELRYVGMVGLKEGSNGKVADSVHVCLGSTVRGDLEGNTVSEEGR